MPYRRPVTQRLTEREQAEVDRLTDDIAALWLDLGGKLCKCGLAEIVKCGTCSQ
jgi:hypothetical protein